MAKPLLLINLLVIMMNPIPAEPGQADVTFSNPVVTYQFGELVTFTILINSPEQITHLTLLLELGQQDDQLIEIPFSPGENQISFVYDAAAKPCVHSRWSVIDTR